MGQFKPMVKMTTTEPSVILKLKKGGKVAPPMAKASSPVAPLSAPAEVGKAPKKPPMAQRMKAMNPNLYAKGGNVKGKQMGGMMAPAARAAMAARARPMAGRMAAPMAGPVNPMTRAALGAMAPDQRAARAAMVRKALTGMKSGGSTAECAKLERELKHHESLSAKKAHKASGGSVAAFAKTKMVDGDKTDRAHGTGDVKMGKPGGYKMGGSIEGNEGPFKDTKMVTAGKGKSGGSTGGVRMGNAGGFKHGGMAYKDGGEVIRPVNTSKPGKTNTSTGEVKLGNAGGYKHGGSLGKAYATGGNVVDDGKAEKMPRRPVHPPVANSLQSGTYKDGGNVKEDKPSLRLVRTHTGPQGHVAKVYKDRDYGEYRVKFFSPDGIHKKNADFHTDDVDDAHDTATSLVKRGYNGGGKVSDDMPNEAKIQAHIDSNERAMEAWKKSQKEEAESTRSLIPNLARKAVGAMRGMLGSKPPPGSVTKTEKSVTVAPAGSAPGRKHGGKC